MAEEQDLTTAIEAALQSPQDETHWDRVEEVLDAVQRPTDVSELFSNVLSKPIEPELAGTIGKRAVRFYESWYGEDSDGLPATLKRVLEIDPRAEWAFERLTVALTSAEKWGELLDAYDRAIAGVDQTARRMSLLDEAAQAAKDFAGDPDRAIGYMLQLFALDPSNVTLASSLERLLERQQRYGDLLALLEQRIEVQTKKQVRDTRLRMAGYYLDKLDDAESALGEAKLVLADSADHKAALQVVESVLTHATGDKVTRREALSLLKAHHIRKNRPQDVVRVLVASLDFAEAEEQRAALREIVERLVDLGDDAGAMPHQAALLIIEPMPQEREALRALSERTRDFARYADALTAAADGCEPGNTQHELRVEAARVCEEELGDADRAIALLGQVFHADAGELSVVAGRRMLRLLEQTDREQETLVAMGRMSELETDDALRATLLGKVARLAEKLGDAGHARGAWQSRLRADPMDVEALDALISAAAAERDSEGLAVLLEQRIAAPGAADRRRDDSVWLARLQAEALEQLDAAIETWRGIQASFGEDRQTVNALTELLSRAERWEELAETLRAAAGSEVERFAQLQTQLGDAYRQRLGRPRDAVTCYRAALYVDPANEGARAGQLALLEDPECLAAAVDSLTDAYGQTDEWEQTLSLLDQRLAAESSETLRAEILIEAAALFEDRKGDAGNALTCYRRAFALIPDDRATEREIRRLAEQLDAWDAVVSAYRDTIATFERQTPRVAQLRFDEGRILLERLGDPEAALTAYEQAAAISPDRVDVATSAVGVAASLGRWQDASGRAIATMAATGAPEEALLSTLEQAAEAAEAWDTLTEAMTQALGMEADTVTPPVLRGLHARVGLWHQSQRGDLEAAETALDRAASAEPGHAETLRQLIELRRRAPGAALIATLLQLADIAPEDLDPLHEAAEVALAQLGAAEARPILERLGATATRLFRYGQDADGEREPEAEVRWTLSQMVAINREAGEHRGAFELLSEASALPFSKSHAQALRHEAARIAATGMAQPLLAIQLYRDILQIDPGDATAIEALGALYRDADRLPELLMLLRHELDLGPTAERKIALRLQIVEVLAEMELRGGPLESLEANLEEQPGHPETLDAITELLRRKGQFAELAAILAGQAKRLSRGGDAAVAADLWRRSASLYEGELGDPDSAIDAYRKLHELEPTGDASEALARIHAAAGRHDDAARWLELRLGTAPPETRAVTAVDLARAHLEAGHADRARGCLEQALEQDPQAHEARALLADIYRKTEALPQLAELLVSGAGHVEQPELKLAQLREAAEIYYDCLDDPRRAIPALEQARALAPKEQRLAEMLARGLQVAERFDEARAVLQELIDGFGRKRSAQRAELHFRLASVLSESGDVDAALSELETATKMDLGHAPAMQRLAELSRKQGDLDRAERTYRSLLMLVRRNPPTSLDETGPSEVFFELSSLAGQRDHADQARELLESALESATQSDDEARRFQRALLRRGEVDVLMRVLDTRLSLVTDKAVEGEIHALRAEVLEKHIDKPQEALEAALTSVELDPRVAEVHAHARALSVRCEQLPRYIDLLAKLADTAGRKKARKDRVLSAELTLRMGEAVEQEMEDYDRAAGLYAKVEASGECLVPAAFAMARVAGARGEVAEQRRVLQRIAKMSGDDATPAQRNDAHLTLAALCLPDDARREEGLTHLSAALTQDPDYARAKTLLRETLRAAPLDRSVLSLFEQVARAARDDDMLLDWYESVIALPDAEPQDVRKGVELSMDLGKMARAESLLRRAAELARRLPGEHAWVFSGLARCRTYVDDKLGAIACLREAVEHAGEAEASALLLELAELAAEEGGDLDAAAGAYEQLLVSDPGDRALWGPLLGVLLRIADRDRLEAFIARTLEQLLPLEDRAHLHLAHARFLVEVEDNERDAIPVLQTLLAEEPTNIEATDLLTAIYQRNGMVDALAELLQEQFDRARDEQNVEAIAELGLRLGDLYEEDRRDDALYVYRNALEWAPKHAGLLRSLLRRMGDQAEPRDRAEVMHTLLESESGSSGAGLARAVISLWKDLEEDERVQQALELGYRAAPGDEGLREQLEVYYVERDLWEPLSVFMLQEADRLGDGPAAVARLKNVANIFRARLEDTERSAAALRRALEIVPDDITLLGELARNLASAGQYAEGIAEVTKLLDGHPAQDRVRVDLLRVRADLMLGDTKEADAVADLEEAYAIAPDEARADLLRALEALEDGAAMASDRETQRAASLRRVAVLDAGGDTDGAREVLARWVDSDTTDVESLSALRQRDEVAGRWEAVAEGCTRLIEVATGDDRIEAALGLAHACAEAGRPEDARDGLERVYEDDPNSAALRMRLRSLYEQLGVRQELADLLVVDAGLTEDRDVQVATYQRAAELYIELDEPEAALSPLEQARALRPEDPETALLMIDIQVKAGELDAARDMLVTAIEAMQRKRSPELAKLQQRMARLCLAQGDTDAQLQWLGQALDTDRKSGEIAAELTEAAMAVEDYDAAMKALRTITMMEDPHPITRAMAFLKQAQIAIVRGDARRAQHWARKAKSLDDGLIEADAFLEQLGA